jgi:CubicO group peptidase (beta-lactamase class C family)
MTVSRRAFLQKAGAGAMQLGLLAYLSDSAWATTARESGLIRSLPEKEGVLSSGISAFVDAVEKAKLNVHSMMVLRHGKVIAEGWWAPYGADLKHTLYSLSKSFTSSAIGLAVGEGRLTVNDKIVSFFPENNPATISENLGKMRVRDLLSMSTGHAKDSTSSLREGGNKNWIKAFLALPVEHEPGTFFVYNSGATYMLSAIIQKVTGHTLLEYLTARLFKPLGIEGQDWEVDPIGINTGGWGLRVKTEDIARFGQMYLKKGVWNGKRILSEAWVDEATGKHIQSKGGSRKVGENDWQQGYGYQFWRCRHGAYRGDGAYGQYCIVMPEQDMVVAITSETSNMQGIMDQVWDHILPAAKMQTVAVNKTDHSALKNKLASLTLPLEKNAIEPNGTFGSGEHKFSIAENSLKISQVSLTFKNDTCICRIADDLGTHEVVSGIGKWKEGFTDLSTIPLKLVLTPVPGETKTRIAASGAWTDDHTFQMTWRFTETAHYETVTCDLGADSLSVRFKRSLAIIGNTQDSRPTLVGKRIV